MRFDKHDFSLKIYYLFHWLENELHCLKQLSTGDSERVGSDLKGNSIINALEHLNLKLKHR